MVRVLVSWALYSVAPSVLGIVPFVGEKKNISVLLPQILLAAGKPPRSLFAFVVFFGHFFGAGGYWADPFRWLPNS